MDKMCGMTKRTWVWRGWTAWEPGRQVRLVARQGLHLSGGGEGLGDSLEGGGRRTGQLVAGLTV